ncbi:inorganic polyphosphate/ATP-NAD Kinase [Corallococcus coralloides DSM 2259]|uniref:Inorganic polyphosphate/ATP-NAD Kinase n=1 Tax=Corallococcus coralloides (strain ATCC 25202 / DSM 2259 / NBRC 100086 / M2) TaxID=1144275 RepID=H8MG43_CORCM|nr:NAD(+)/NADH kinase [Corallococcus coralloides]AFE03629.1 inorganic polyphosphate/ATP-NAD Kinase [Corallococcus coralloides DSM 2259]
MQPGTSPKALIVYKRGAYESKAPGPAEGSPSRPNRVRTADALRARRNANAHKSTLDAVTQALQQLAIAFDVQYRDELADIQGYELVISVGGDGTFLETAHYLKEGHLLGVNSAPQESVGFFCKGHADNFFEKAERFLRGKARIQPLNRLELDINGVRQAPLVLNDILFANQVPAGTSRYELTVRKSREEQKSSGVWIAPAPGSTAAIRSAGGRRMFVGSDQMQYVVREAYTPPGKSYQFNKGILEAGEKVQIRSLMDDAAVYLDLPHRMIPIPRGAVVSVRNARTPLLAVW